MSTVETTPQYSIVTTCKGRLHQLQRSLPSFVKQPDCEVVVVDYSCPDGATNTRQQLFAHIRDVVRDPKAFEEQGFRVEVELPVLKAAGFIPNCEFTRTLVVGAKLRK